MSRRSRPIIVILGGLFVVLIGGAIAVFVQRDRDADERVAPAPTQQDEAALIELIQKRDTDTFDIEYDGERKVPGEDIFRVKQREIQRPPAEVDLFQGAASGTYAGKDFNCQNSTGTPQCDAEPAQPKNPESEALKALFDRDFYRISAIEKTKIASEQAKCFTLDRQFGTPPEADLYGDEGVLCFANDGVPLKLSVKNPSGTTTLTARSVSRDVTEATITEALGPYASLL